MLAHAFLSVMAATQTAPEPARDDDPIPLIPLTRNEIRRLFTALVGAALHDIGHRLRWSTWRRRHQAQARTSHYRRQATRLT
jgi:hypothetical protein